MTDAEISQAALNAYRTQKSSQEIPIQEITPEKVPVIDLEKEDLKKRVIEARKTVQEIRQESNKLVDRIQREKETQIKYAITEFAQDMLPIADGLSAAIEHANGNTLEGLLILQDMLEKTFAKHGVTVVPCITADPNYHQVISGKTNKIIGILRNGYLLQDRLIREAMVITSNE